MDTLQRILNLVSEKFNTDASFEIEMNLKPKTVYDWKRGKSKSYMSNLAKIADYFDVSTDYLLGKSELRKEIPGAMPIGNLVALKLIASVRAGYSGTAVADWDGQYENIPEFMLKGYPQDECVLFKVKGDSMYPRLLDGDLIVVHTQSSVDSGDTAIVVYNGDEGTVKKVKYAPGEDWLELIPSNPEYPIKRIEGIDLEQCHVYGKVIGLFRDNI